MMGNKKKINFLQWIYLFFSVALTSFILVHAFLPASESAKWSGVFVRFFTSLFNGSGKDTTEVIDVKGVEITYPEGTINSLKEYTVNEIPLGLSKTLDAVIFPDNATNTAVTFTSSDPTVASIKQDLNHASITGLKEGTVDITVTSMGNTSFTSTYHFDVIPLKAPNTYTVNDATVYEGSLFYLPITCENKDYYDVNKLVTSNSNKGVVNVSSSFPNLYYASSVGESVINTGEKSFKITVKDKNSRVLPSFAGVLGKDTVISGSLTAFEVDFNNVPSLKDVYWESSDPSLATFINNNELKIGKVTEETKITVTAHSFLDTSLSISKEVTLKPVTITDFALVIPYYGNHITNLPYMGETGEEIKVWMEDNTGTIATSGVIVTSSDESVAKVYVQGSYLYINCLQDGNTRITVTSINNPEVSKFIDLQVVIRGVINHDNYISFSEFIRKSIGHFLLFLVDGVFTFLFFYELDKHIAFDKKKKWYYIAVSVAFGLLLAGLSELIQYFVPTRYGSFTDVGVDFLGYVIGVGIVYLIIYLVKRHREKKKKEA